MSSSLNRVELIGYLGKDPEIRSFSNGGRVANFSVATSENWKDKNTGERREKTEWHRISVTADGLVGVIEKYISKGSKVFIEGKLETRKYEKDGRDHYTTEVVIKPYSGRMIMLDSNNSGNQEPAQQESQGNYNPGSDIDDEIPF